MLESDDCIKKGMLRKGMPSIERMHSSIKLAKHYLERGEGNAKLEYNDVAFLMAYNAMFQCCRALLFKDGIVEHSHYCAIKYIREKYANTELGGLAEILDNYRQSRHILQYEGDKVSEKEARNALEDAKKLIEKTRKIIEAKT